MAIIEQMTSSYSMETGDRPPGRESNVLANFQGRTSVLECILNRPEYRMETEGDRHFSPGKTLYWGISYYFPSNFDDGDFTIIQQIHNFPSEPGTTYPCGGGGHKISARDGALYYDFQRARSGSGEGVCDKIKMYDLSQLRGKWLDIICKHKISGNNDGIFQLYGMVGNSGTYTRLANYVNVPTWWNNEPGAYFKFGIYKGSGNSDWGGNQPCVIYCNDYRLGDASLDEVKPVPGTVSDGSTPPPPPPPPDPTPQDILYIDAGSSSTVTVDGKKYVSDEAYRTGGTVRSVSAYTNPVYNNYVIGNHSYSIPVVSGNTYDVKFLLSEVFHTTGGARVFDIKINGTVVANDIDLFALSGYRQPHSITVSGVSATSGTMLIEFVTVVDNAIVAGIEVVKAGGTTPPPPNKLVTRINAGGGDVDGFGQDDHNNGGSSYTSTSAVTAPSGYTNVSDIYKTERNTGNSTVGSSFSYSIPATANAAYTVRLHFCELRDNTRVFHVNVNGVRVLSNFNPRNEAGGKNIGIYRDFSVTPTSATINITFTNVQDRAQVSALEAF